MFWAAAAVASCSDEHAIYSILQLHETICTGVTAQIALIAIYMLYEYHEAIHM